MPEPRMRVIRIKALSYTLTPTSSVTAPCVTLPPCILQSSPCEGEGFCGHLIRVQGGTFYDHPFKRLCNRSCSSACRDLYTYEVAIQIPGTLHDHTHLFPGIGGAACNHPILLHCIDHYQNIAAHLFAARRRRLISACSDINRSNRSCLTILRNLIRK